MQIGATTIRLTTRPPEELGAKAVVRFFPSLARLEETGRAEARLYRIPPLARAGRPQFPGDPVVRPLRDRPGAFTLDVCLAWTDETDLAARERSAVGALDRAGPGIMGACRRWELDSLALAPLPDADAHAESLRFRALWSSLRRGLEGGLCQVETVWICAHDKAHAQRLAATITGRATDPAAPRVSSDQPTMASLPLTAPRPRPARPAAEPIHASTGRPTPSTFDNLAVGDAAAASSGDDAWIADELPFPMALPWHLSLRHLRPEDRLQALLGGAEIVLRSVTSLLLADYLRGPRSPLAEAAIKRLRKPTFGDWSKVVDALAATITQRRAPAPFYPELSDWAGQPSDIARQLTERRNTIQHGRGTRGPAVVRELHALLRGYLLTLRWLTRYELVHVADQGWTRDDAFTGHWLTYRGREPFPPPVRTRWRGGLAQHGCYMIDRQARRALDLSPFVMMHPDASGTQDALLVLEALPKSNRAIVRQPCGVTACRTAITSTPDGPFWDGGHTWRIVDLELDLS